eukprot:TRINITY_DN336_c0_g1_i1.p1 TRINITY_DN336_c0_g1~~TRINITY_DN336_c0_g1_i1.p1  ORF type:complete len:749 (+),score=271.71 TRINITY_DN336_c0_g1_i1:64-2247(+)
MVDMPPGSPTVQEADEVLTPSKHPLVPVESSLNLDVELKLPLDDGDGDEIDFNGIDEDLRRFQTDDIVRQALSQGVDLRGYSRDIETELREVEMDSVREYVSQSDKVLELHNEIQGCDAILARMQEMLLGFQADLGGISDEIRHLQDESISLNVRLKNRRAAEARLAKFLENVLIPPELASAICGDEVNERYLDRLVELNSKLRYVLQTGPVGDGSSLDVAPADTMTAREVRPHLEKLRAKACARARDYLLSRISELRKPKTNVQIIQKTALLKYKYLVQFLSENAPETAEEVRNVYIESMGRTIYNLFRAYQAQLAKLELEIATKTDLIAVEEAAVRAMFTNKVDLTKRGDAFTLGERDKILDMVEAAPILVHVAQAEGSRLPYEVVLRSVLKHLVDSATSEYLFTLEFFRGQSRDTFHRIFERTTALCVENLETYLFASHDAIGLLLMIKLTHAYRLVMQRRRIPVLEAFFDRFNVLLWPRFKMVFDANLRSVSGATPRKLGTVELTPHYVTRRYAEFAASLLALHSGLDSLVLGIGGEEMLLNDLAMLRTEVVKLMQRLSLQIHGKKNQVVFLINNYDQVLTVFHERRIMADETTKFEELLAHERESFVEEELKQRYARLIAFVQANESLPEGGGVDEALVEGLVRDFAATWKSALEAINQDVLASFSNFRNGMEILKQVLTQLLLFYTRFQVSAADGRCNALSVGFDWCFHVQLCTFCGRFLA